MQVIANTAGNTTTHGQRTKFPSAGAGGVMPWTIRVIVGLAIKNQRDNICKHPVDEAGGLLPCRLDEITDWSVYAYSRICKKDI